MKAILHIALFIIAVKLITCIILQITKQNAHIEINDAFEFGFWFGVG